MTFKSSLMFAKSLIFSRAEKKSSARRSLWGALLCIGLSIVPLVVVLSVTKTSGDLGDIETIVEEETAAFFEGQKTAADVCKIIQSRASIYLKEIQ